LSAHPADYANRHAITNGSARFGHIDPPQNMEPLPTGGLPGGPVFPK